MPTTGWSWTTLCSVALPLVLWGIFRLAFRKVGYFYFDPQDVLLDNPGGPHTLSRSAGTFDSFLARYVDLAKLVINLAIGSIAVLSGYVSYVWQKSSANLPSIQAALGPPLILLAFSVTYAVCFLISLNWSYETYVSNYKSYTSFWAAVVRSFAFSGTMCFAAGYLWLALAIVTKLGKP